MWSVCPVPDAVILHSYNGLFTLKCRGFYVKKLLFASKKIKYLLLNLYYVFAIMFIVSFSMLESDLGIGGIIDSLCFWLMVNYFRVHIIGGLRKSMT